MAYQQQMRTPRIPPEREAQLPGRRATHTCVHRQARLVSTSQGDLEAFPGLAGPQPLTRDS